MKIQGSYLFNAPPEKVWALLMDNKMLAKCIPGCKSLQPVGRDKYDATLSVGIAMVKGSYKGSVAIVEKKPPLSYKLLIEGSGGPGFVKGEARVSLADEGGNTKVTVDADAQVAGTIARVGQRLIGTVSKRLMDNMFRCLQKQASSA